MLRRLPCSALAALRQYSHLMIACRIGHATSEERSLHANSTFHCLCCKQLTFARKLPVATARAPKAEAPKKLRQELDQQQQGLGFI